MSGNWFFLREICPQIQEFIAAPPGKKLNETLM